MANLKDVIYISNEDYQTLVSTGTVVIGTETLTYDENNLYLTPETIVTEASFLFSNSNWVSSININQFNSIKDSNIIYVLDDENITHYFVKGESNLEYNSQNNRWEGYINYLATDYSGCTDLHLTWNSIQENYTVAINSYTRVKSVNNIFPDVNGNISVAIGGGTVTSVGVGTGLSISGTATVNPTINIASDYKLPKITEWNGIVTSVDSVSPTSGNVALSAVKYVFQSLTDAQKSQARTNIGAGTSNFTGYTSSNKLDSAYITNNAGWVTGSVVTTSGSQSVTINNNTLSFGANAFNSTAIPTSYVSNVSATPNSGIAISGTTTNPTVGVDSTHKFLDFVTASNIDYTRVTTSYGHLSLNSYEYGQGDIEGIKLNLYNTAIGDDVLVVNSNGLTYKGSYASDPSYGTYFCIDTNEVDGTAELGMRLQDSSNDSTYFEVTSSSIQHNGTDLQYAVEIIDLT